MAYALDKPPPRLVPAARSAWARAAEAWPAWLWRALHPASREAFADTPALPPLPRRTVAAGDGRVVELQVMQGVHSRRGEPVLLLPTLGLDGHVFRHGASPSLATRLHEAGLSIWFVDHRAQDPVAGAFDGAVRLDLPAAIAHIVEESGFPRVHVVGHGYGGLLAYAWASWTGGARLASLATLGAPVVPSAPAAWQEQVGLLARLPRRWAVPGGLMARWSATQAAEGARRRGALVRSGRDVGVDALRHVRRCWREGALVAADGQHEYGPGLRRVDAPLWLAAGEGDAWCTPGSAFAARTLWGDGGAWMHELPEGFDHLDVLLHPDAATAVHAPLAAWIVRQRARAWREAAVDLGARTSTR